MHAEIEAKLKVDSLAAVERRLRDGTASFLRETVQTDVYFDTTDRKLTRSDECLRLRSEKVDQQERLVLAYKGPKQPDDFKKRAEVEVEVRDANATEMLLMALGYSKALAFNKKRRLWRLHDCEVALDELPLVGTFVEIEGPDSSTIARVQETLGLSHVPHTRDSYASLIDRALSGLGQEQREVYLKDRK
jgi:adenylate cyclase class 2